MMSANFVLGAAALPVRRHAPAAHSAGAERKHPLHVPGHCNEAPLTADVVEPAQQELAESHHGFNDSEHRFRGLFAQGVLLILINEILPVTITLTRETEFMGNVGSVSKKE